MSKVAMFTSESFVVRGDKVLMSRSRYDTVSLMCEPFDEVVCYMLHADTGSARTELFQLPDKYHIVSIGPESRRGKLARLVRMGLDALRFPSRMRGCDVAYVRIPMWDAYVPALCAILLRRRRVVSLHGDIEEALEIALSDAPLLLRKTMVRLMGMLTRFIVKHANVLFISGSALGEKYACDRHDAILFLDSGYSGEDIIRRRSVCDGPTVRLLYVGELTERKGITYLLRAVRILRKRGREIALRIVGEGVTGGDLPRYRREAEDLGIAGIVEFVGYVPYGAALFEEYRKADILILPSIGTEGWSRVIIEANANGALVVTTDVGSLGHAVRECNCGLIAETASADSIADRVEQLLDDPDLRRLLLEGAWNRARLHSVEQELTRVWKTLHNRFPEIVHPVPADQPLRPSVRLKKATLSE